MNHLNEMHRMACEVRFWRSWAKKNGRAAWNEAKDRIAKKRGLAGLNRLLLEMNRK